MIKNEKKHRLINYQKIAVFLGTLAIAFSVHANPVLDQVTAGDATVTQTQNTTTINQTSDKAIIEWNSFNIGANETTHFQQPVNGVALNRINPGQGASQIFGTLTATGRIILVNQAGIFFGSGAHVDVGGIIASTSDISNDNFMAGKYIFDKPNSGAIDNEGSIRVANYGLVALIGNNVTNNGYISAKLGSIVLASGSKFTISFDPDQLLNFTIDAPADSNGKITNTGTLVANGGIIMVTAQAAKNVLDDVIDMRGVAIAHSVSQHGGVIYIGGGSSGRVHISGKLIASSKRHSGGTIKVTGQSIDVASTAVLNANAGFNGNGGNISVIADDDLGFHGSVTAQGGSESGDGGSVETSGHYLDLASIVVNLIAPGGAVGTWLLDPADLTIDTNTTTASFANNTYSPNGSNSDLNVTDLQNALASANVTVQTSSSGTGGNGDIFVNSSISWSGSNTLTLSAYRNVTVANSTTIINTGNGSVVLRADNAGGVGSTGRVSFGTSSFVYLNGGTGSVSIYYNPTTFGTQNTFYSGAGTTAPIAYMLILALGSATDAVTVASLGALSYNNNNTGTLWAAGKNYALAENIDATATGAGSWNGTSGFTPIGSSSINFAGAFDGQNFTISNLTINNSSSYDGLFGNIGSAGIVKNINMTNASITSTGSDIGMLAGLNAGNISNASVGGSVSATGTSVNYVGGAVGYNSGTLSSLSSSGTITTTHAVGDIGGLVGYNQSSISNSNSSSAITVNAASSDDGGLVGYNATGATLNNDNSTGSVTENTSPGNALGGFAGYNNGTISNSYSTDTLAITAANSGETGWGGFIGTNDTSSLVTNVYSNTTMTLTLTGTAFSIGGLIGQDNSGNYLNGSTSTNNGNNFGSCSGTVCSFGSITMSGTGQAEYVGGLVGRDTSGPGIENITNSFTSVTGSSGVGGLVGQTSTNESVLSSSSTTNVSTAGNLAGSYGGLVGSNSGGTVNNSTSSGTVTVNYLGVGSDGSSGGLVGFSTGIITNSHTSGTVIVSGTSNLIGGFVGKSSSTGSVSNDYSTGTVTVSNGTMTSVGGFIGENDGSLSNSYSTSSTSVTVNANSGTNFGGFAGLNTGSLSSSHSSTSINVNGNSNSDIGGLIGQNTSAASLSNVYSTGNITLSNIGTADTTIGGFIGSNASTTLISGSGSAVGPCSGSICTTSQIIVNSGATAPNTLGSFIGSNSGPISNITTPTYTLTGGTNVGGLIGSNSGAITNASSTMSLNIINGQNIGGLIGTNSGTVSNVYSIGTITYTNSATVNGIIGGLIGSQNTTTIDGSGAAIGPCAGSICAYVTIIYTNAAPAFVGGFLGTLNNAIVTNVNDSFSGTSPTISGIDIMSAFIAETTGNSYIRNSSTSVNMITLKGFAGGLAGQNVSTAVFNANSPATTASIYDSSYSGTITVVSSGAANVGGLVGKDVAPAAIYGSSSSASIIVNNSTSVIGDLVGQDNVPIYNSYSTGTITINGSNTADIGGLVGLVTGSGSLFNVNSTSNIVFNSASTGDSGIGGLVGVNSGSINSGTSSVNITTTGSNVGGLVGSSSGTITSSSSNGVIIIGGSSVGSLVGLNTGSVLSSTSNNSFASIGSGTANASHMSSPTQFIITGPNAGSLSYNNTVLISFININNYIGNGSTTLSFSAPAVYNNTNNTALVGGVTMSFSGISGLPSGAVSLAYVASVNNTIVNTVASTRVPSSTPYTPAPSVAMTNMINANNAVNNNINSFMVTFSGGATTLSVNSSSGDDEHKKK